MGLKAIASMNMGKGGMASENPTFTWRKALFVSAWMAVFYYVWLVERAAYGQHSVQALTAVAVGFGPFLIWSLVNYRTGILLTLLAIPYFQAPDIPHFFTQGFGDLFAIASICGFLVWQARHGFHFDHLWNRGYIWLCLLLAAAALSLVLAYEMSVDPSWTIRYGLADIASLLVHIGLMVILVSHARSLANIQAAAQMLLIGFGAAIAFGALGAYEYLVCPNGFYSPSVIVTEQRITATFGAPNSFAAYVVTVLPIALWVVSDRDRLGRWTRWALVGVIVSAVTFALTTMSRAGLLGLIAVWLMWAVSGLRRGNGTLLVTMGVVILLTPLLWNARGCSCADTPYYGCRPLSHLVYILKHHQPAQVGHEEHRHQHVAARPSHDERQPVVARQIERSGHRDEGDGLQPVGSADVTRQIERSGHRDEGGRAHPHERQVEYRIKTIITKLALVVGKDLHDNERFRLWLNAIDLFEQRWILGIGIGQTPLYMDQRPHNVLLMVLLEQGVIGVSGIIGWWAYLLVGLWRSRSRLPDQRHLHFWLLLALVGTLVMNMFNDDLRMLWIWAVMGLAVAAMRNERAGRESDNSGTAPD